MMGKRNQLIFAFTAFFVILMAILLIQPYLSDQVVMSDTFELKAKQRILNEFDSSSHESSITAKLTIDISKMKTPGRIRIFNNEFLVAKADINHMGKAVLVSGTGCGGSCLLEESYAPCIIRNGNNIILIESENFEGQLTYKISIERQKFSLFRVYA